LCKGVFKASVRIGLPEKRDREILVQKFLRGHQMDFGSIARNLQGKTSFEIK